MRLYRLWRLLSRHSFLVNVPTTTDNCPFESRRYTPKEVHQKGVPDQTRRSSRYSNDRSGLILMGLLVRIIFDIGKILDRSLQCYSEGDCYNESRQCFGDRSYSPLLSLSGEVPYSQFQCNILLVHVTLYNVSKSFYVSKCKKPKITDQKWKRPRTRRNFDLTESGVKDIEVKKCT